MRPTGKDSAVHHSGFSVRLRQGSVLSVKVLPWFGKPEIPIGIHVRLTLQSDDD
jgi:hypothetical protein